jgi:thiosulfate/3-mercaptopyruvate sulfurtransferase
MIYCDMKKGREMKESRSYLSSCYAGAGIVVLLALFVLANGALAGEAFCDACKGDSGWSGASKLDEIGDPHAGEIPESSGGLNTAQKNRLWVWNKSLSGVDDPEADSVQAASADNTTKEESATTDAINRPAENTTIVRSEMALDMLAPLAEAEDGTIYLDISESAGDHISGSVYIPYTEFLNGTDVKSEDELAAILGDAGISRDDPIIIYGKCMPCGGGPAPAAFVYWIMRSLGHENVRILDGAIGDWSAAGLPTSNDTTMLPAKSFTAEINPDYAASYSYVESGEAQIVDARTIQEFGNSSIPGAINIPYEGVISGDRLKDESKLERVFGILDKEKPVVVYTNTGIKASVVWFALEMLGYDAKLYSYKNYRINQEILRQIESLNQTQ